MAEIPVRADPTTGFSPRGAVVEPGAPAFPYTETERDRLWAHNVASLYEQATAAQWDASVDIRWGDLRPLPTHVERAVCQIMTHLAENEYAALYVPARFIPRIHPHFAEVVLFLATQVVDEARHIEAFTKRALANGGGLQFSTAMTQTSLKSLLEQEDFTQASFLLSVLGEGTFLEYLAFVERYAPDPVTADVARRARVDEARHVAFGVEHARHALAADPDRAGEPPHGRGAPRRVPRRRQWAEPACRGGARDPRRRWRHPEQDPGRGPGGPCPSGHHASTASHASDAARLLSATAEEISEMHTPNFM